MYPRAGKLEQLQKIFIDAAFTSSTTDNPQDLRPCLILEAPEGELHIPEFYPVLKTLDQVVDVDYYMPGCPPESHQIALWLTW